MRCVLSRGRSFPRTGLQLRVRDFSGTGQSASEQGQESAGEEPPLPSPWSLSLPAASAAHFSLGIPLGVPLVAEALSRDIGVVASATADWGSVELALPGVSFLAAQALTAAMSSRWQQEAGPAMAASMSSVLMGCGMAVAAAGVSLHALPLIHLGVGCLGGMGAGLAFAPVMQGAMAGRPQQQKGIAAGTTALGFGLGAGLLPVCIDWLSSPFRTMPTCLGSAAEANTTLLGGKLFAMVDNLPIEAVEASGALDSIAQGLYIVGTGSSGIPETLALVGAAGAALSYVAANRFFPVISAPSPEESVGCSNGSVANDAVVNKTNVGSPLTTRDFHLLGLSALSLTAAGTCMFSLANPLVTEMMLSRLPDVLSPVLVSQYVALLAGSTIGGRFLFGSLADYMGNRGTLYALFLGSIPIFLGVPALLEATVLTESVGPMNALLLSSCIGCSIAGGAHSVIPAYLLELVGEQRVGGYLGNVLPYLNGGVLLGLIGLPAVNEFSRRQAYCDILDKVPPEQFLAAFGEPLENARTLIATHSISLDQLVALLPPGVTDPAYHIYDRSFTAVAVMLALGTIAHTRVMPPPAPLRSTIAAELASPVPRSQLRTRVPTDQSPVIDVTSASNDELKLKGIHAPRRKRKR